ncbi:MAG: hypothetical protein ACE5LQ_02140 [Candidatus Bipolaricaulia bacterium]
MWIWGVVGGAGLAALALGLVLYDRAGRRRCPNCEVPIPKSATTCPHCSGRLEEYLEEQKAESTRR